MKNLGRLTAGLIVSLSLLSGKLVLAQTPTVVGSPEDKKAIEAVAHGNPSDHVTDDVSFTNIFGSVRYGRDEFIRRHIEIAQTFFKGTTRKKLHSKIALRPAGCSDRRCLRRNQRISKNVCGSPCRGGWHLALQIAPRSGKRKGFWWITEYHNVAETPEV